MSSSSATVWGYDIIELTRSQAAHKHIASPDAGSTAQQPIGADDQAALEFNVSSKPLLTRSWRSSATIPPNHGATQGTGTSPSPPPQDTTRSSSSSGPVKKSRKMNLCAHEWLARNKARSAVESTMTDCQQQRVVRRASC